MCIMSKFSYYFTRMALCKGRHFTILTERKMSKVNILVVGLGNYDRPKTRHSVGMRAVDRLASHLKMDWTRNRRMDSLHAVKSLSVKIGEDTMNCDLHLLKPTLPMNANGASVRKIVKLHSLDRSNVYIVHDELDKVVGKYNIKEKGSASGHNGVRSVISCLAADEIIRLRIGIDRPSSQSAVVDYVLSNFTELEAAKISEIIDNALITLLSYIEKRMNLNKFELTKLVETFEYNTASPLKCAESVQTKTTLRLSVNNDAVSITEPALTSSKNKHKKKGLILESDVSASRSIDPSPDR